MIDRDKDPIGYAVEVVGGDPFATMLGIKVEEARDSYARLSLLIKADYCNSGERTHGGVLFSLADQAFAVAANSRGYLAYAIEVKINYFQAAKCGDVVTAEATPVDIRKRVSLWNVELKNQDGEKIAIAQGLGYHFV
jgi:acyl-CoA thioesterase